MGVNTQGIINSSVGVSDIIEILENKFDVITTIEDTHNKDYKQIVFDYNGEDRRMSVFVNYSDISHIGFTGMDKATLIDLNLWGSSIKLIEGIVEEFGGFVIDNDCSDEVRWVG